MIALYLAALAALTPVGGDTHDFGEVLAGTEVRHTFVLENGGDRPIEVRDVRPTCSLEAASFPSLIPAGERGEFSVVLRTDALFGRVLRGLIVRTAAGETEEEVLFKITGVVRHPVEIYPEGEEGPVMGWAGEPLVQAFTLAFHDPAVPRVEILGVETAAEIPLPVRSAVEAAPDGKSARIVLHLDAAGLAPGSYGQTVSIRTSHPKVPLAEIPVSWLVRDPLILGTGEIVFHGPSIFRAVEVQFPCRAFKDESMKQPYPEPLGGKGYYPIEAKGDMKHITNGQISAWVASSCLKPLPPGQAGQTRYFAVSDGQGRPLRIGSIVCAHPLISTFWRQTSASSCMVGVTLAGEPERDETVMLELEIETPRKERREIPIRLVRR